MAITEIIQILADPSNAIKGFERVQKAGQSMAGNLKSVGSRMVGIGQSVTTMTAPIAVGFAAIGRVAANFEQAMLGVKAITGATEVQFKQLSDQAKELGSTTEFSATQAANAQRFLAMAGFEVSEVLEAMPGLLDLATAGQLGLAEAADIASNVLTGYGFEASQIGYVNDVLAKTATSANTNIQQLGEAFKYGAPIAKAAGIEFTEAAAMIAAFSNAGIQASQAGTTLRGAIARLMRPTKETTETLHRLQVSTFDSSGQLRSMADIIGQLERSGASARDMLTIFGQEAGSGMTALLQQGSESLINFQAELDNSEGAAKRMADTMRGGLTGQMASLTSALEGLALAIADTGMLDMMTQGTELLTKAVQWMAQLPPPVLKTVTAIGAVAVALGPVLIITGTIISSVGQIIGLVGSLGSVLGVAQSVFVGIGSVLGVVGSSATWVASGLGTIASIAPVVVGAIGAISAPVWLTIGGFVALGAAIGVLVANWDKATAFIGDVWLGMVTTINESTEYWKSTLSGAFVDIQSRIQLAWTQIKVNTSNALTSITQAVTNWGSGLWNAGRAAISNLIDGMRSQFDAAITFFNSQLRQFRDLLPGSEPRDTSSPLANLRTAGEAVMSNFATGFNTGTPNAVAAFAGGLNQLKSSISEVIPQIIPQQAQEQGIKITPTKGGGGTSITIHDNRTFYINGSPASPTDRENWLLDVLRRSDRDLFDLIEKGRDRVNRGGRIF